MQSKDDDDNDGVNYTFNVNVLRLDNRCMIAIYNPDKVENIILLVSI